MTAASQTAFPVGAPFKVFSVHFDFPGGQAIKLRDPVTNQIVGASPEWVSGGRNELAAYVRASRPSLRVVFRAMPAANGTYTVGADGIPFQVAEQAVTLAFDPSHGRSGPVVFQAANDLPDVIGLHAAKLDWYVRVQPAPSPCPPAGTSTHRIATSWRAFVGPPAGEAKLDPWVYRPLMEWTCQWAAGLDDEKEICDAILAKLPGSGLRYGVYAADVRQLLMNQEAMCGVWYQALQQMAHCQGVFVYRRRYLVDWRQIPGGEDHWCAIVIRSGGLNQVQPTHPPSAFRDNDTAFPIPAGTTVPLVPRTERRYRFWGLPNTPYDGHCVNFLIHHGQLYLYDACFRTTSVLINAPLPANNTNVPQGGDDLAPFKAAYLDGAIDYMLGSIWNGPNLIQSVHAYINGMTVRTGDIPGKVGGRDGLSFRWGN